MPMPQDNTFAGYTLQQICAECEVPMHVLVYWADYFQELKDANGRLKAEYSQADLSLVRRIKKCLYSRFLTVEEARRVIDSEDVAAKKQKATLTQTAAPKDSIYSRAAEEKAPQMPEAPIFAKTNSAATSKTNFADLVSGGLNQLEEVLAAQKNRFNDEREEFSVVKSDCAARLSELSAALDCEKEKNIALRHLLEEAVKDLEALRIEVFGDK